MTKKTTKAGASESANVFSMKRPLQIEPLEGWTVQTKYGTLRQRDGTDCVRLQDVHTWLLRDGAPASAVNWKMFAPLLDAARDACDGALDAAGELAACKLLGSLHLVCANDWPAKIFGGLSLCKWGKEKTECQNMQRIKARPLFSGADFEDRWVESYVPYLTFMQSDHVKVFRSNFPALGHHRFEDGSPAGLIYGIAEGVVRIWRGPVDIATDPVLMGGIKKDRAEEDEYRIEWPSDDVLSLALERVAVPVAVAHDLWGWGRAVALQDAAQAAPKGDVTEWTPQRLWEAYLKLEGDGKGKPMMRLAEISGIGDRKIRNLIKPFRSVDSLKTSPFGGLLKQATTRKKHG